LYSAAVSVYDESQYALGRKKDRISNLGRGVDRGHIYRENAQSKVWNSAFLAYRQVEEPRDKVVLVPCKLGGNTLQ
jgi:hypothetical protein